MNAGDTDARNAVVVEVGPLATLTPGGARKVDTPAGPVAVLVNAVVIVRSEARTSDGWQSDDDM